MLNGVAELKFAFSEPESHRVMSSDQEGPLNSAPPLDDELTLPKATVQKMIAGERCFLPEEDFGYIPDMFRTPSQRH